MNALLYALDFYIEFRNVGYIKNIANRNMISIE
jgi:hypothetical protein